MKTETTQIAGLYRACTSIRAALNSNKVLTQRSWQQPTGADKPARSTAASTQASRPTA